MRFLVETSFKQAPAPDVLALIPAEVAHGKTLDARGIREILYVAASQSKTWQIYRDESAAGVERIVGEFPLTAFLDVHLTALAGAVS